MDIKEKAEEFFNTIVERKKTLVEIPLNCSNGETGTLLYMTFIKKETTAKELAEVQGVSLPRMVSILNSLEEKKLINKRIDNKDRRITIITITDKGKKLVLNKKSEAVNKIVEIMKNLSEDEINNYLETSKKISNIISNMKN